MILAFFDAVDDLIEVPKDDFLQLLLNQVDWNSNTNFFAERI